QPQARLRQPQAAAARQQRIEGQRVAERTAPVRVTRTVTRSTSAQRLSAARQQQLIAAQRQRSAQYAAALQHQTLLARQRASALQAQRRANQYRFQQQYLQRLQQQQYALRNTYN